MTADQPSVPASLLRHRPLVGFWLARVGATVAIQMQSVAVGWQIYEITRSPLDLGLVGLAQFLPTLMLFLLGGHAADHYDRRLIYRACLFVECLAVALLALGTFGGWISKELIFAVAALLGGARAFESPAQSSLLPTVVPTAMFPRAVAGVASGTQFATIAGPAIGGLIYAASPVTAYALASGLLLFAALTTLSIAAQRAAPKREPFSFVTLFGGFIFMRTAPVVLGAISLDLFAVLLGGVIGILPVFAHDILQSSAEGLGLLRASPALGAMMMSLVLAYWPLRARVGRIMYTAVAIYGVATLAFAASRSLALSMLALFVLGAADLFSMVIRSSLVQLHTPDAMRGRVSAINYIFIGTSNQLGEFRAGVMAYFFGPIAAVVIGGVGTLAVVAAWMRLFPKLFNVETMEPPPMSRTSEAERGAPIRDPGSLAMPERN
jgi:MFS family permease